MERLYKTLKDLEHVCLLAETTDKFPDEVVAAYLKAGYSLPLDFGFVNASS